MTNEIIVLDPEQTHGPAFSALTELQQKFVVAQLILGGTNDAEAARVAGFSQDRAKQTGYDLMRNQRIIAAMKEEADLRMQGGAMLASSALLAIVKNPLHKEHFKACVELLNRSGLQFIQKHEVIHRDDRTAEQLVAYIRQVAPKLLGVSQEVVDAEYVEVHDPELAALLGEDDGN
jgi:phage terminase small subunit